MNNFFSYKINPGSPVPSLTWLWNKQNIEGVNQVKYIYIKHDLNTKNLFSHKNVITVCLFGCLFVRS